MKDLQLCQHIVELGRSMGATEVEAYCNRKKKVAVKIEKNDLHIPKGDNYAGIGIRVIKDGKMGYASTNQLDDHSLRTTIETALAIAESSIANPFNQLPDPKPIQMVDGLTDLEGFHFTVDKAVERAQSLLDTLTSDSRITIDSANVEGSISTVSIANSRGIQASEDRTIYWSMMIGSARDGDLLSSFDAGHVMEANYQDFQPEAKAQIFTQNLIKTLGATSIPKFKGSIIMAPAASHNTFLLYLVNMMSGDAVLRGISPLKEKLGKAIAHSSLNLYDDPTFAGLANSRSFDREGLPSIRLPLIEKGILQNFYYDHRTALKAGVKSTGHSVGDDAANGLNPTNMIIESGTVSYKDMIKNIKQGVLVSRFSGNTNAVTGDFSGVVKGGFYIENGEIVKPIREVMIAGNFYEMLHNIEAISLEREKILDQVSPYIQFGGISITGKEK